MIRDESPSLLKRHLSSAAFCGPATMNMVHLEHPEISFSAAGTLTTKERDDIGTPFMVVLELIYVSLGSILAPMLVEAASGNCPGSLRVFPTPLPHISSPTSRGITNRRHGNYLLPQVGVSLVVRIQQLPCML